MDMEAVRRQNAHLFETQRDSGIFYLAICWVMITIAVVVHGSGGLKVWDQNTWQALISCIGWALVTAVVYVTLQTYPPTTHKRRLRVLLYFSLGIICTYSVRLAALLVGSKTAEGSSDGALETDIWQELWKLDLLGYCIFLIVFWVLFSFRQQSLYRSRQLRVLSLKAQLSEARLESLRAQLNPHFLFNTLHAVSALVEEEPKKVVKIMAHLGHLLRHVLEKHGALEVTLNEELGLLEHYLGIIRVRFQKDLTIEVIAPEELGSALVPDLILQPLVENAIEHGLGNMESGGRIQVLVRKMADTLVLSVSDNGKGLMGNHIGVGVGNSRERLLQIYGQDASFSLALNQSGGVTARIELPYHEQPIHPAPILTV